MINFFFVIFSASLPPTIQTAFAYTVMLDDTTTSNDNDNSATNQQQQPRIERRLRVHTVRFAVASSKFDLYQVCAHCSSVFLILYSIFTVAVIFLLSCVECEYVYL